MRFAIPFILMCLSAVAQEPVSPQDDASTWIIQLSADDAHQRQSAMESLRKAGERVRSLLDEAAKGSDKNRAVSAKWLLAILKTAPLLEKAKLALTATKPVTAVAILNAGEKEQAKLEIQTLGDGKHARMKSPLPPGNAVADGTYIWAIIPALDKKSQTIVMKRTVDDLKADIPGALVRLPAYIYIDALMSAFDFTTIKDQQDGDTSVTLVEGWLKRPEMLSQRAIMDSIRAGDANAQQLLMLATIKGLARTRITINKDYLPFKIEMQDRDGKVLQTNSFEYDFSPIPEDVFRFDVPAGATVVDMSREKLKEMRENVKEFIDKHDLKSDSNDPKPKDQGGPDH